MLKRILPLPLLALASLLAAAQTNTLNVPLEGGRSGETVLSRADAAVRDFARTAAALTRANRAARVAAGLADGDIPFSLPTTVRLTQNGVPLKTVPNGRARSITLDFDPTFPPAYRAFLAQVFNDAQPTIDAAFGEPAVGGTVRVANFDATIGDRDAIAGGYYVPNDGTGTRQIRFPIYTNQEAAAVNLIHAVLLAYEPDAAPGLDAFLEGPVRAATMRVVRQRSAVPSLDAGQVEAVLANSYDIGARYDWNNQPALSGARFIAPNLRDTPLPAGGSLGGLYLLRYIMAGSAFEKVLAEHPTFLATFNGLYNADPSVGTNRDALVALGQQALNALRPGDPSVEGLPFANWAARQAILDTDTTAGVKLHVETQALENVNANEAGAFLFQASLFQTLPNGNETLLGGTTYPITWTPSYDRIFPDGVGDRVDIAGAYGSYAPGFPKNGVAGGTSYRAAVDVPVLDRIQRVYVPVGTVRAGGQSATNDLYGTLVGFPNGSPLTVRATVGSEVLTAPVVGNAFGINTLSANFQGTRSVLVEVLQNGTVLLRRRVNKGPGALELDLRLMGEDTFTYTAGLPRGLSLLGLPVDPFFSSAARTFAIPTTGALLARYNAGKARYELYPELDGLRLGQGVFVRAERALPNFAYAGRTSAGTAIGVALRPGWNLVANPLNQSVSTNAIQVVRAGDFPLSYVQAVGTLVGPDVFGFAPGAPDPASGAPETGTLVPDNVLESGVGFFVRCLAPEGATLLFLPPDVRSPGSPDGSSNGFLLGRPQGGSLAPTVAPDFLASLTVFTEGESSRGEIASARADALKLDSPLPPGVGGLQVVVGGSKYREVGFVTKDRTTTIDLNGLRPGRMYRVEFAVERGKARTLLLTDPVQRRTFRVRQRAGYAFRATGTTRRLTLKIQGASR